MAYGTASIRAGRRHRRSRATSTSRVAKREVAGEGRVGVPSAFAGPSEVVVVADDTARPTSPPSTSSCRPSTVPTAWRGSITWDERGGRRVDAAVAELVADAPRRAEIESRSPPTAAACSSTDPSRRWRSPTSSRRAPRADHRRPRVAGAAGAPRGRGVLRPVVPASIGDYVAGPTHVLPTTAGALRGRAHRRRLHEGCARRRRRPRRVERLGPAVIALADAEGLAAHAESIRLRRTMTATPRTGRATTSRSWTATTRRRST